MSGDKPCVVCNIVSVLVGVGALNWGLAGVFGFDLVAKVLGEMTMPAKIVYGIIGLAGLIKLVSLVKPCPCCAKGSCQTK